MKKSKENITNELKELKASKLLNQLEKEQEIPENYFENLLVDVSSKIEKTKKKKVFKLKKVLFSLSIAAAFIILFSLPFFQAKKTNIDWNQFSKNDLKIYINQNIEEFSDEEIASISDLKNYSIFSDNYYSNEEIEEYLITEDFLSEESLF